MRSAPAARKVPDFPLQEVTMHGQKVAYRLGGSGPVLVLLHGVAGRSETWLPVMQRLAADFTVLAPDLLGHGQTAKPLGDYSLGSYASGVRDLLHVLEIDRGTLVGHSFGGGVAMQFAYQYPEFCERLVLVDAGGLGREVSLLLRLATMPGAELVMPILFPEFLGRAGDAVLGAVGRLGLRNPHVAEIWSSFRSLTDAPSRRSFIRTLRAVIEPGGQFVSALDRLYLTAATPTLIVWGDHDAIIPMAHAYQAHDAVPESRVEIIEGVGHSPQVEAPDRFVAILRDFLATTEPAIFTIDDMRAALRAGAPAWPTDSLASDDAAPDREVPRDLLRRII